MIHDSCVLGLTNNCELLSDVPTLPRVGMLLEMPASFARVSYFGRGPHENYCDRKSSAFVGRHSASVQVRMLPRQSSTRR